MTSTYARFTTFACALAMLGLLAVAAGTAEERQWNRPGGGSFGQAGNWTPSGVPGPADQAVFNLGAATPYTVTLVGPVSNDALLVHTDRVALDLGGATYSLTSADRGLVVGELPFADNAWLRLANGSVNVSAAAVLGLWEGSTGELEVGAGASLSVGGTLIAGNDGSATLRVADGGQVSAAWFTASAHDYGGAALVEVAGAGSLVTVNRAAFIGEGGAARLSVSGGGEFRTIDESGWIYIGMYGGSRGEVNVGPGGSLQAPEAPIVVGNAGNGTLTVTGGGQAASGGQLFVGDSGGIGQVTVIGLGSSYQSRSAYGSVVGGSGEGLLTIADRGSVKLAWLDAGTQPGGYGRVSVETGGVLETAGGSIGQDAAGAGLVVVTGAGSQWKMCDWLFLGVYGQGSLVVTDGGVVSGTLAASVGQYEGGQGSVKIAGPGSRWDVLSDVVIADQNAAKLRIEDGGAMACGYGTLGSADGARGEAVVVGPGATLACRGDLVVGGSGQGYLTVADGAHVAVDVSGFVGREGTAVGEVTVTGAGSRWAMQGELRMADLGRAALTVADGGYVSCFWGHVGMGGGGQATVTVTDAGSELAATECLVVGEEGSGTLNVLNGGRVSCTDVDVAAQPGSAGTVTVGGAGALIDLTGGMYVGNDAGSAGLLTVADGGTVNAPREVQVQPLSAAELAGGTVRTDSFWVGGELRGWGVVEAVVSGPGSITATGGTLTVGRPGDQSVLNGVVHVDNDATLEVLGDSPFVMGPGTLLTNGTLVVRGGGMLNTLQGYGIIVGDPDGPFRMGYSPAGRVSITHSLDVGAQNARIYTAGPADLNGLTTLAGGWIYVVDPAADGQETIRVGAGGVLRGQGYLAANVELAGGVIDADAGGTIQLMGDFGRSLSGYGVVIGDVTATYMSIRSPAAGTVALSGPLDVGGRRATFYSTGPATLGPATTLDGGTITAHHGLRLPDGATFSGRGIVDGAVAAEANTVIAATGDLRIGDWFADAGFSTLGVLDTGAYTVTLESFGEPLLGGVTALRGGTLQSSTRIRIGPGARVRGGGLIAASVMLDGGLIQTTVGGRLTITQTLAGYGIVLGDVSAANMDIAAHPSGTVNQLADGSQIDVGDQTGHVYSQGPALMPTIGKLTLGGGVLHAPNGITSNSSSLAGFGAIDGRLAGTWFSIKAQGGVLTVGDPSSTGGVDVAVPQAGILPGDYGIEVAANSALELLDADAAQVRSGTIALDSGVLIARNGLALGAGTFLNGCGVVVGQVTGGSQRIANPTGPVWLDLPLEVGAQTARVYSAGQARLGDTHVGGGTLWTPGGTRFEDGRRLSGHGAVQGNVELRSGVIDADAGAGQTLTIHGDLGGYGVVVGPVQADTWSIEQPTGVAEIAGQLNVLGRNATIDSAMPARLTGTLALAGGSVNSLMGVFVDNYGTLAGFGQVNGPVYGAAGSLIAVQGGDLRVGDPATYGFGSQGVVRISYGSLTVRSGMPASLGLWTDLNAGTLNVPAGVALGPGTTLAGWGAVNGPVAAAPGSVIQAGGVLSLGDPQALDGFRSDGTLRVGPFAVTLRDRNQAVLAALTTLGAGPAGGTLSAPSGMLLEKGKDLVGLGDVFGNFENQGHVAAKGTGLTFHDTVTGSGGYDGQITFAGAFSPGNSPAIVGFGGSLDLTSTATLRMELADDNNADPAHPRYDALAVAQDVAISGTLSLTWLPVAGDPTSKFGGTYDLIVYAGQRTGAFAQIESDFAQCYIESIAYDVPVAGGLKAVQVVLRDLLDCDANLDGRVSRSDLLALEAGFGSPAPAWSAGDFNFDGQTDAQDYLLLKASMGRTIPGAVPEPATLALLALSALFMRPRRRRPGPAEPESSSPHGS